MNCQEFQNLCELYLTGELDQERAAALAAHLGNCSSCAQQFAGIIALDDQVRRSVLALEEDSRGIERRVQEAIAAGVSAENNSDGARWNRWVPIAAALLLAVGLAFLIRLQEARAAGRVVAAAQRDHRFEITEGQLRRWLVEDAAIEKLAASQGVAAQQLRALTPAGYRLAQGKICRLDGQLFLHLVFAQGATKVSVFVRQSESRSALVRTAGAAGFCDGQFTAVVVTGESPDNSATSAGIAQSVSRVL